MRFAKMHGLGNDYIYISCFEEKVENPSELAVKLSDRHFGIGSDGLVLICPSEVADFRMEMYNADGSQGEMCGNAARCIGKYVYERELTDKTEITLETLAGIKILKLNVSGGKVETVTVDMGEPEFEPEKIPVLSDSKMINAPIEVDGKTYYVTCVSMGNPHAVVYLDEIDSLPLEKIGSMFENHRLFPKRINTEFVKVIDRKNLKMRVWERGSGETLACGTGACAVLVASVLNGKSEREASVHLKGGVLNIKWDEGSNHVFMTGSAEFICEGVALNV